MANYSQLKILITAALLAAAVGQNTTAGPSAVPTPAPTGIPARQNCVCMSENMLIEIARYCPSLRSRFREGCMRNVTRAHLEEYSKECEQVRLR